MVITVVLCVLIFVVVEDAGDEGGYSYCKGSNLVIFADTFGVVCVSVLLVTIVLVVARVTIMMVMGHGEEMQKC